MISMKTYESTNISRIFLFFWWIFFPSEIPLNRWFFAKLG